MKALIGYSGYVGSTLMRQGEYDALFRSTNIDELAGRTFDQIICTAAPAQKWVAERDPAADLANIERLADALLSAETDRLILISTVDVFDKSDGMTEADDPAPTSAYGRNRLHLERRVRERFPNALIVRLPGLVGPGLRKNAIFDFRNDNNLQMIDARGVYQFYPMVNLTADLALAEAAGLKLLHGASEPMSLRDVAGAFGRDFTNEIPDRAPARYDLRSDHAALFGGHDGYLYDKRDCLLAIRAYAQSEPASAPIA